MKPSRVVAFCPGHISGYFRRVDGPTPMTTGSIGGGMVITEGVQSVVEPARITSVTVRQVQPDGSTVVVSDNSPLISDILEALDIRVSVTTECRLPIGAGFGLSAAALLATLIATDRLYSLGLDRHRIVGMAHEAEVLHGTGLGDVAGCQGGGLAIRKGPGIDAEIARNFDLSGPLYALSFGPMDTPTVLGSPDQMARVFAAYPEEIPKTVPDFFAISRRFSYDSGLCTPEVSKVLHACEKEEIPASMTMLGKGVFAYGTGAADLLAQFGHVYMFHVAENGPRITEVVP
jgi:pantoate kinase